MGASRESQNIWLDIKNKNWSRVRHNLKVLFSINILGININPFGVNRWSRNEIIKDSFNTPFNKKFGCKLFGHRWSTHEEEQKYDFDPGYHHCWKCSKWITDSELRDEKLKKLLK
jgi:hypothetical protein